MIQHFRVVDDRFVAGFSVDGDRVIQAAPILHRWIGRSLQDLQRRYPNCRRLVAVQTAHVSHPEGIDVSRMTGDSVFAPSWTILRPALDLRKQGRETAETWAAYEAAYLAEMATSRARYPQRWHGLVDASEIVLKCYCVAEHLPRCHRIVLAKLLRELSERDVFGAVDVCYLGAVRASKPAQPRQALFSF